MEEWRQTLDRALEGDYGPEPLWPAFHDAAQRYKIPHSYFHSMIDGVSSDLEPRDIQTFDELYHYFASPDLRRWWVSRNHSHFWI